MPDLDDGDSTEMKGSAAKPYVIKNIGGVYSCTCPAWRNQSLAIEKRTCKHIRKLRGDEAEKERVGSAGPLPKTKKDKKDGPPLLLAEKWDNSSDLTDWWMSEKLDGVRAYWDGEKFLSRQGNQYLAPDWFIDDLPKHPLDGELWLDRKKFQRTVSIVRRQDRSDHWKEVRFLVFDAPAQGENFEGRLEFLTHLFEEREFPFARFHEHMRCKGLIHLHEELARIDTIGGEGLMLREPGSNYAVGRSSTLLKVKQFHDAEALVLDHHAGKGKHKGRLGALVVQLDDGTQFSVGTGFTDAQRSAPPPIGSVVTFRYQELSDGGVPRFPTYIRLHTEGDGSLPKGAKSKKETPKKAVTLPDNARRFEYQDEKSHKFWEVGVEGSEVTIRYGRVGANGQTQIKSFDDTDKATLFAEKQIQKKTGKGYVEAT